MMVGAAYLTRKPRRWNRRSMVVACVLGCTIAVALEAAFDHWRGQHHAALVGCALALALVLLCTAFVRRHPLIFFEFVVAIASCAWVASSITTHGVEGIVCAYAVIAGLMLIAPTRYSEFYTLCVMLSAIAALHRQQGSDTEILIVVEIVLFTALMKVYKASMISQRQAVDAHRSRLDLLLQCSDAGCLEWNAADGTAYYSPRLCEMLGLPPDADATRIDPWSYLPAGFRERVKEVYLRQTAAVTAPYESMPPVWMEYPLIRTDKRRIWVHARAIRISGADGPPARCVCTFVDITERLDVERRLRLANARVEGQTRELTRQRAALEKALRAREEVEHMARHDLRTPLGQIVSIADSLRSRRAPVLEKEALLLTLEVTARRAMRMLKLAMDFYPIEDGRFEFVPEPVDLVDVVRKVCDTFNAHAETKRIGFVLHAAQVALWAQADAVLCETILENLLKNAIESAPVGSHITFVLTAGAKSCISIHNEGMVPAEVQGNFFQKYSTAGKPGGTGLGTYSARIMARAQNGELSMTTSDLAGTQLVLELQPAHRTGDAPAPAPPVLVVDDDARSCVSLQRDILVVDDDAYSSRAIAGFAAAHGVVRTAANGRAALESAKARRPDVILMDLEMPVMGGIETVGLIRRHQAKAGLRPSVMVALSAHDDAQTRRRCQAAGFDRWEGKPISRARMAQLLDAMDGHAR